ncbi:MAG: polysaccharide deacetylase family protein [Campylobacterales bacterium]|nr:polysaccharide deacetylase family protein [Campylobacterales bacterium]
MKKLLIYLFLTSVLLADVTIFAYHRFGDTKHPSTSISIEKLRKDFQYLKDNGYRVAPLKEIVDKLKNNQPLPKKTVVLTIDDAYRSFYQNGLTVFKEFNYPFTLMVYTKATEKKYRDFMRWDELRDSMKYGGEIAFHTHTHPHMTHMSDEAIGKELQLGYDLFVKRMGFKPDYFAYPYGEFDDRVKELVKKYDFKAIFNQNSGAVSLKSDIYDIDRIAIGESSRMQTVLRLSF